MTQPGEWRRRWLGAERPDRRSFPQSDGRAALLVPRPVVNPLASGQRCGLAPALLGCISCWESDSGGSPFAPLGPSDRGPGEDGVRSGQHRRGARRRVESIGRGPRAGQILPPSQRVQFVPVLSSSTLAVRSVSASVQPDRAWTAVRGRAALPPATSPSGVRGPDAASLGRASPPSSPSAPPMRCPGSGLQRSRRSRSRSPCAPPRRSRGTTASPHPAGGGDPASAARATVLAYQVLRRGRLYPYKGTRGPRIVSARRGELMRSFRGVQVRCVVCDFG
jgi:hypothetical protein